MIRLFSTTRKLQAVLAGAVSSTQPDVVVCFHDLHPALQAKALAAHKVTTTNSANAVDICDAPEANTLREVDFISLRNNDTASVTATIRYNDNGTTYIIARVTLLTLEMLMYSAGAGWQILDVNGNVKYAIAGAIAGTTISASGIISANGGGIAFPATQVASADPNTLDDYEEQDWTPVLTFATAGDVSVSYTTQLGRATKIGRQVVASFVITTSAFTHTTAAGNATISGLPYTSASTSGLEWFGPLLWGGITKAGYTQVSARLVNSSTAMILTASGSGVAISNVTTADMPTGGSVVLRGGISYVV